MSSCQQDSLSRLIYLTSLTIRKYVERVLKPYDLTNEQFHILKNLEQVIGRPQSELCGLVGKSAANITRILDRLEKKQLIVRRENPEDRRSSLIFQTKNGSRLVDEVSSLLTGMSAAIERNIAPEDDAVFREVLARIDANLERLE